MPEVNSLNPADGLSLLYTVRISEFFQILMTALTATFPSTLFSLLIKMVPNPTLTLDCLAGFGSGRFIYASGRFIKALNHKHTSIFNKLALSMDCGVLYVKSK